LVGGIAGGKGAADAGDGAGGRRHERYVECTSPHTGRLVEPYSPCGTLLGFAQDFVQIGFDLLAICSLSPPA
jgi:hypothetical protein